MNKAEKNAVIEDLKTEFAEAKAVFITDYRGIEVNQLTELRKELNKSDANFRVIKNRLALRAVDKELREALEPIFDNTTAITLAKGDMAASAKALTKFAKSQEKLKIKGGILDGKVINIEDVKAISSLPSREELLAKLLGTLQAVPQNWVRVLNAIPGGWVNVLDALRRKKEGEE